MKLFRRICYGVLLAQACFVLFVVLVMTPEVPATTYGPPLPPWYSYTRMALGLADAYGCPPVIISTTGPCEGGLTTWAFLAMFPCAGPSSSIMAMGLMDCN